MERVRSVLSLCCPKSGRQLKWAQRMSNAAFATISYEDFNEQAAWRGVDVADDDVFRSFMTKEVGSRLHDTEGAKEFEACLRGLPGTGFARDNLSAILAAEVPEERSWAVGEALAEAYLESELDVAWPWNKARDVRTPNAILPGADLIGFEVKNGTIRLALGEVKTSGDKGAPPNVMSGRSGMTHQIDVLATNLSVLSKLLRWLFPRCMGTKYEASFKSAVSLFLASGNKAVALFGMLIRDTTPNEMDLKTRGQHFANTLTAPTTCLLAAVYVPCPVEELPGLARQVPHD